MTRCTTVTRVSHRVAPHGVVRIPHGSALTTPTIEFVLDAHGYRQWQGQQKLEWSL
jgi:hypothetical protein